MFFHALVLTRELKTRMDYKFSPEEQTFQLNELSSGYKIIEEEKMIGVKTTCIDSRVIVLVGDFIGFFSSLVLLILSPLFRPISVLLPSSPCQSYLGLNLASKVCGVIGHLLGHLSAVGTNNRLIFSSILFNLLEVSFSSTKILFLTAGNNLIYSKTD